MSTLPCTPLWVRTSVSAYVFCVRERGSVANSSLFSTVAYSPCDEVAAVMQELEAGAYFGEIAFLGNSMRVLESDNDSPPQV